NWNITDPLWEVGGRMEAGFLPPSDSIAIGAAVAAWRDAPSVDLAGVYRPPTGADLGCFQTGYCVPEIPSLSATTVDPVLGNDATGLPAFKTIQAALAVTADGGTCNIGEGTYVTSVIMPPRTIHLRGAGIGKTILSGVAGTQSVGVQFQPLSTNCTVEGIGFEAMGSAIQTHGENPTFRDLAITAMIFDGIYASHTLGTATVERVSITECDYNGIDFTAEVAEGWLVLRNSLIAGNKGIGLTTHRKAHPLIENCIVTDNANIGLWLRVDNVPAASTNLVRHCTVTGNGGGGLYAEGLYNAVLTIENNLFLDNGNYGLTMTGNADSTANLARNLYFGNGDGMDERRFPNDIPVTEDETYPDLFVDPLALLDDYAPAFESLAHGAAKPSDLRQDYYGRRRPVRAPDIGAVQIKYPAGTTLIVR
ncbi:MAG: right-handed parallel beta-helix repeat-containing protein, partial [Kiritimatiellaeota bacterium]|nr:right-handed parallel beta-helix repeat-containing protein [Kiritimatiellota bacterium]